MIIAVMPAYNEEKTVFSAVQRTKSFVDKIIVVDDASFDATASLARKAGATVVSHEQNRGLGSALRTGFSKALSMKADIIITIDADGQHDPADIPKLIEKIKQGYGFVLGRRDLSKYPFIKKFGNLFLNAATNFISGTSLKDTESGSRAFSADSLKKLRLIAERYEIAVEIIFEVGRNNIKYTNVPIASPVYVKGVGIADGVKNFLFLMRRRERSMKDYWIDFKYVMRNALKKR
ncbi:MAG: glycosyltransferase family 2 protein [Candidatus Aenigmarchaeota archaeon]|nr:glycosyltransferase family 2 protein [Candidatus Aenigmarchaeota archaeon]